MDMSRSSTDDDLTGGYVQWHLNHVPYKRIIHVAVFAILLALLLDYARMLTLRWRMVRSISPNLMALTRRKSTLRLIIGIATRAMALAHNW